MWNRNTQRLTNTLFCPENRRVNKSCLCCLCQSSSRTWRWTHAERSEPRGRVTTSEEKMLQVLGLKFITERPGMKRVIHSHEKYTFLFNNGIFRQSVGIANASSIINGEGLFPATTRRSFSFPATSNVCHVSISVPSPLEQSVALQLNILLYPITWKMHQVLRPTKWVWAVCVGLWENILYLILAHVIFVYKCRLRTFGNACDL